MTSTSTTLDRVKILLNDKGLILADTQPQAVTGGDICESLLVSTIDEQPVFIKYHHNPPADFFSTEARNLEALRQHCSLKVPLVIAHDQHCLALEYLGNGDTNENYWPLLAEGLAELHQQHGPCFGFNYNNFCGTTRQPNPRVGNGLQFFIEHRLDQQIKQAADKGLLAPSDIQAFNSFIQELPSLLPQQSAVLIHGDLWRGNVHCDFNGEPCLIDPACYWGWREADIAMTTLFGCFPDDFYSLYQERLPMEKGWQQRLPFYNLYHLLNHLNLFGEQYLAPIRNVINRFL